MAGNQNFVGIVKSFNPNKGWGFVECAETYQLHQSDVFLLKNELNGYAVAKGDKVSFGVSPSPKGVQAIDVKVLSSGPGDNQSFFGEIKSFNPQKGFGFISGLATEQLFGKDVFVMKSEFPGGIAPLGAQVQFKAKMGERGPVASEVQLLGAAGSYANSMTMTPWAGSWQAWGPQTWGGQWGQWGMTSQQWGWGSSRGPSENGVYFGILKQVNAEKGWGHVSCEATHKIYGKDMFIMKSNLENLPVQPGQTVSFSVTQGPKGPHAANIRPFNTAVLSQVFTGEVKSYNDQKGWGFIESHDAKPVFFTDIFLHKREMVNGQAVAQGHHVQFAVEITSGRAAAKHVTPVQL